MTLLGWRDDPRAVEVDEAVILLPSLGTTAGLFDELVTGLSRRCPGLAVLRADLPGHGTGPLSSRVDIRALAAEVAGVIEGLPATRVAVAGVSMGGAIAFETARLQPAGLRRFAMINSAIRFGTPEGWRRLIRTVETSGMEGTAVGAAGGWFSPAFGVSDRARQLLADIPGIDPTTYIACCRALADYSGRERISDIAVPALLVGTADDEATPPSGLRSLARSLSGAEYFELPHGRHLSLVEHAVAVETIVAHALENEVRRAA